jgi:hypothetical protein
MKLNSKALNDYRLHAITALTGASVAMTQVEQVSAYAPVAAGLAFLLSASNYADITERIDDLAEDLEEAGIISEEVADKIDKATDVVDDVVDSLTEEE